MNKRISTVIVTAILVTLTSGCRSSMSSLWFGRGARCGMCNKTSTPQFGNAMQAPCESPQYASPAPSCLSFPRRRPKQPQTPCQSEPCQSAPCQPVPTGDCGCNSYADQPCGGTCGSSHSSGYGDCGCGNVVDGYAGGVNDPYLSGGATVQGGSGSQLSQPYPGQVIDGEVVVSPGQVIDGQVVPGTSVPGSSMPLPSDNWQPRSYPQGGIQQGSGSPGGYVPQNYQSNKFDTDGKKILWEEPLTSSENQL